ncbi:ubiquinone biosynthesis methyltransferase UbiE [Rhizobium sp. J15]|uniref:ubiquinone biosynthesis methyltransferase UbiE n=1 Tax=Rhizobium sp. J15 TaxID=2035450 RepID=UPI001FDF1896|nr:ubiquinone biosynthesis methyltransferase UbiE [Rhizobium sp. J15]
MQAGSDMSAEAAFKPLLRFEMDMATFLSDWQHCDQLSTFVARMISHNRTDPIRHSNFFSFALNELLEVSFRGASPQGSIDCAVYRRDATERVRLSFTCPAEQREFYREAVSRTRQKDALARYLSAISMDQAPNREVILLDLAINFDARLRLEEPAPASITLVVDLPLEGSTL